MSRSAVLRKIPSSYLVCEDDRVIPVQPQDGMIARVKELGRGAETGKVLVSHSLYLAKPEFVSRFLRRAPGGTMPEAS
jgi:hypothetical protein